MTRASTKFDFTLASLVGILILTGLVMLASAGNVFGLQRHGDSYFFLKSQLVSLVIGLAAGYLVSRFDYHRWWKLAVPLFLIGLATLVIVFLPGIGSLFLGARRWINLGPVVFQPSELVKLTLILYLGVWFTQRQRKLADLQEGLIPFLITLGSVAGLIILQPDLGSTMVLILIGVMMFFAAGGSVKHLALMGLVGAVLLSITVLAAPYRANRLTAFLNPGQDPQGIGYHTQQARIAIGSGGLFGVGLGHSKQKYSYLPEPAGDSIFAIMAEELGFVIVVLYILAWSVLILRGMKIARSAPDTFGRLLAVGIIGWLGAQALINMAALAGLVPLTGIPLPFLSHGGSALIMNLVAVGILLNISAQAKDT